MKTNLSPVVVVLAIVAFFIWVFVKPKPVLVDEDFESVGITVDWQDGSEPMNTPTNKQSTDV